MCIIVNVHNEYKPFVGNIQFQYLVGELVSFKGQYIVFFWCFPFKLIKIKSRWC